MLSVPLEVIRRLSNGREERVGQLAGQAGLSKTKKVLNIADELYDIARNFHREASHFSLPAPLITSIQQEIDSKWRQLRE
ncbi:hypothetical protein J8655_11575 [Dickeya oryzae]|uniref:hypothetical protein n=1 Tax=Dickeya oryzae TaxID=1240404 RepID=UPI001AECC993|nr:hypothetical protein [Dickeya oryzae]MBP2846119.1 hypothetical protein [Dickeya oryzae]